PCQSRPGIRQPHTRGSRTVSERPPNVRNLPENAGNAGTLTPLSRFFKSAAFPILIVALLAFCGQRLLNTGPRQKPPTSSEFLQQLDNSQLKSVELKTKSNTVIVKEKPQFGGKTYETGYTDGAADRLDAQLSAAVQSGKLQNYNVEGRKSSAWVALLTYI